MSKDEHILSSKILTIIWILLLILTYITYKISQIDLGYFNVLAALTVATTKAALVVLFFMHLKYESNLIRYMVFIAFLILAIFIGFTFFDVSYR
jgi:cytochrome c oxidase subunit 4